MPKLYVYNCQPGCQCGANPTSNDCKKKYGEMEEYFDTLWYFLYSLKKIGFNTTHELSSMYGTDDMMDFIEKVLWEDYSAG